jgi:hypothetical protein
VTVKKKADELYHSYECAAEKNGRAGRAKHPDWSRWSLEAQAGIPVLLKRTDAQREPGIVNEDGGYLPHRPFDSQGKQDCLCY